MQLRKTHERFHQPPPLHWQGLIPNPFPLLSVPYTYFHLFSSLAIPCIPSYSFPSLPSFLNPSYTFPSQPSGFPPFSFIPVFQYFPSLPIPSDPLSSHPFRFPIIPSLPILYIPSHSFPSLPSLHHPCPYFPIRHHPFPLLPSLIIPPRPFYFSPFQLFPTPSRDSSLQILSHPFPSLTLSHFFSILPVPFRFFYPLHPFPSRPCHPIPSLPVPFRSRTSGSEGYEAHPGQVERVFCLRGRRRHDHFWPMATSIGINIGSRPHWGLASPRLNAGWGLPW